LQDAQHAGNVNYDEKINSKRMTDSGMRTVTLLFLYQSSETNFQETI